MPSQLLFIIIIIYDKNQSYIVLLIDYCPQNPHYVMKLIAYAQHLTIF